MANCHIFRWNREALTIQRYQFIPDTVEGAIIEYRIINEGNKEKQVDFLFTGYTDLRPTWLGERTNMTDAADVISFDAGTFRRLSQTIKIIHGLLFLDPPCNPRNIPRRPPAAGR